MPYSNYLVILFLLFGTCFHISAQEFEKELRNAIHSKPKLEVRFDSRTSFINQTGVRVSGFKLGVQFDNKLSFGMGYNFLGSKLKHVIDYKVKQYYVRLRFYTFSPYVEYVFYRDQRWELSIPVQFGFGSSFYSNENQTEPKQFYNQFVISYEPAIAFQYRFLRYFGAGMGIGYRLMIKPNTQVSEKFTSPVYIFKIKLYFQDVLKDIKDN